MPLLLPRTTEQGAQLDEDEKEEEGEKDEEEGEEREGGAERGWRDGGGERMGGEESKFVIPPPLAIELMLTLYYDVFARRRLLDRR